MVRRRLFLGLLVLALVTGLCGPHPIQAFASQAICPGDQIVTIQRVSLIVPLFLNIRPW